MGGAESAPPAPLGVKGPATIDKIDKNTLFDNCINHTDFTPTHTHTRTFSPSLLIILTFPSSPPLTPPHPPFPPSPPSTRNISFIFLVILFVNGTKNLETSQVFCPIGILSPPKNPGFLSRYFVYCLVCILF